MLKIKLKAQSWSIDIALGVIIFMAAFFIFYALLSANPQTKAANLKEEASIIIKQLVSGEPPIRIVDNNNINLSRVNQLKNISYEKSKTRLRGESDFCIYMEDDKGNIVPIESGVYGIGSSKIEIGGVPCTQR